MKMLPCENKIVNIILQSTHFINVTTDVEIMQPLMKDSSNQKALKNSLV